ncbi:MAG: 50S rRNA methyltransferase, partial [Thermodesulfobacteria bacterium]|nr:50S rRNA methyltransferase [Thermodesulfobacteriota bacterium]
PQLKREAQELFKSVKIFKPKSSRAESVEKFLFCQHKKK